MMSGRHGYIVLQISVERKTGGHVASTGLSSMSALIFVECCGLFCHARKDYWSEG